MENGTVRGDEGLKDLNRRVAALARSLKKPVVATGDVHFLDPKDEIYRRILLAAKNSPTPTGPTRCIPHDGGDA